PLLGHFRIPATWFVIGRWVERYPALHRSLLEAGHELANHTWSHPDNAELRPGDPRKFDAIAPEEARKEIATNHHFVRDQLGYEMRGFRLPHFRPHPAADPVLQELGYAYTSNLWALRAPSMGTPFRREGRLLEFPLAAIPRQANRIVETYRLFRRPDGLYRD